jgi:hypothetical protein
MLGFEVNKAIRNFFDVPKVVDAVTRAKLAVFSKAGAFVRRTAKGLIRKGKKPSRPGSPPHDVTGILKRFIYFALGPSKDSVVIGPAKTNQIFFDADGQPVKGTVPEVLEYGGQIGIEEVQSPFSGRWRRRDFRYRRAGTQAEWKRRRRIVRIEARPYMGPALQKNQSKFPGLWADSVH